MKKIKITGACSPCMWYAALQGREFQVIYEEHDCYWTCEPAGYKNIVMKSDAIVLEM